MIKNVLIDIDNTLLDFNKSADMAIKMGFSKFNLVYTDNTFATFKTVNDELWRKIERREITRTILHEIRFDIIFQKLNIDFDGKTFEKQFLENLNVCACHVDNAEEIMSYLSKKYNVYTASNAPKEQQLKRLKISGLDRFVKKSFISQEIGFDKPDKRFFDACFKEIDGEIDQAIFIGDSLSADIIGGINYGLKTVWFNFEAKENVGLKIDYVIDNLLQLKSIL